MIKKLVSHLGEYKRCLLYTSGSDVVVDVGLTLGTHGDVGDLAANSLFQILNVIAGFLGQILPLAGGSDIAVPAGQILHHGLCGVQSQMCIRDSLHPDDGPGKGVLPW